MGGEDSVRAQDYVGDGQLARFVSTEYALRLVNVAVDNVTGSRGQVQEPKHVAASKGRYECFLRIHCGYV